MNDLNHDNLKEFFKNNYKIIITLLAVILILTIFKGEILNKIHFLFIFYFIIALVNHLDSRYSIISAIILLLFTAVLLSQKREGFANQTAIYAYYFLIIGVVLQIFEYFRIGEESETENLRIQFAETEILKIIYEYLSWAIEFMHSIIEKIRRGVETWKTMEQASPIREPIEIKEVTSEPVMTPNIEPKPPNGNKPRIMAITSGKGGVGKTTLAANLATSLSEMRKNVMAMDLDITMPNLEMTMGVRSPPIGLADVIKERLNLDEVAVPSREGVRIIPPGIFKEGYTQRNIEGIKRILKKPPKVDFLILDMPSGPEAVSVLNKSHEVLLITTPDKASVSNSLKMKQILDEQGIKIIGLVLNMIKGDIAELSPEVIEEYMDLRIVSLIPEDRKVREASSDEIPAIVKYPYSKASKKIKELAMALFEKEERTASIKIKEVQHDMEQIQEKIDAPKIEQKILQSIEKPKPTKTRKDKIKVKLKKPPENIHE